MSRFNRGADGLWMFSADHKPLAAPDGAPCSGECVTCCYVGPCAYSSNSRMAFAWTARATDFVEGDFDWNPATTPEQKTALLALLNSIRTGAVTATFTTCNAGNNAFWVYTSGGVRAEVVTSGGSPAGWATTIRATSGGKVAEISMGSAGQTLFGTCCGWVNDGSQEARGGISLSDGATLANLSPHAEVSSAGTVSMNWCCSTGSAGSYTGTENCSSSASDGQCEPGI